MTRMKDDSEAQTAGPDRLSILAGARGPEAVAA
jgi:hypothetical protein